MRVNPNPYPDLLADIGQTQQAIQTDEQEIATGQTVNLPSDDPSAAATLVQNASQTSEADQFERSLGSIQGEMQNADSALDSVVTALQQAITLGTEGANGTLNADDRQAIAAQVQGIQSQLLGLANLTYQGSYVFGGTANQSAPYVLNTSSPSGVTYQGNSGVNTVTLGNDFSLQTNLPGTQLFSASGTDMFQSIQDLITGLQSGSGIGTAVNEVSDSLNSIDTARVFYDNGLNQLNSQQTYLSSQTQQLAEAQNSIEAANLPEVISNLTSGQVSLQATLETIGQTSQTNLFDYLR
ncbi:MAG TPA: flagellar hook-associated protein FlgL [Candidatus Aquilonibacter sp.]|nr:flagellar hook-associated protein FlgL [Candidatus Aquilonibacter sp.]